jgi:hypothetical protein
VDSLYELVQLSALGIAKRSRLLVPACVVNIHLVGHGVACRACRIGGGGGLLTVEWRGQAGTIFVADRLFRLLGLWRRLGLIVACYEGFG